MQLAATATATAAAAEAAGQTSFWQFLLRRATCSMIKPKAATSTSTSTLAASSAARFHRAVSPLVLPLYVSVCVW